MYKSILFKKVVITKSNTRVIHTKYTEEYGPYLLTNIPVYSRHANGQKSKTAICYSPPYCGHKVQFRATKRPKTIAACRCPCAQSQINEDMVKAEELACSH